MPSENNLNSVFTDIANSIRSKKGTTDTIKPVNMADEIDSIEVGGSSSLQDFLAIRNANSLFNGFSKLTYEQLSSCLSYDDTSKVTNMYYMFNGCSSLTTIPLLNTSKVTNMSYMFYGTKLTTIPQFNTSKVDDMSSMFGVCRKLTSVPQLDTRNVTNMSSMFNGCYLLEKIDITKLADGTGYNSQFAYNCYSLKTLVIRTMDTIPTLNSNAFQNCYHFYGTTNATYNPNGLKDGRIYVPDDKVESLKTATNWSVFADIIMPLTIENGEHISRLFIDSSTLSLTISRNVTIYLYGFTNTPTVNINVSNEGIAQINNLTVTTEKITFEVIALGEDGNAIISIDINGDYSKELSFEVSYTGPIEYRVEQISEATYGFALNSNEYYESTNKKVPNSYALCKLVFNARETNRILKLECINSGESNYDFGILSNIDTTLSSSSNADTATNVYKSFKGQSSTTPVVITYPETTVGEHFIYIKYCKDSSGGNGNDSLQFKVIL